MTSAPHHIETSPLICKADHWVIGFYPLILPEQIKKRNVNVNENFALLSDLENYFHERITKNLKGHY